MDRTVYDWLYHYWFRCEVEGIEHVPAAGGALLVSNHSGALPPDAAMIPRRSRRSTRGRARCTSRSSTSSRAIPGFSMLVAKIGGVPAHPANVHRLLHDEEQLVLVFPEGRKGTEKLYKDRYKLRRFGRGGFVEAAMRAQVPIVPVAVVGAEEAMPIFAQIERAAAPHGPALLPDHADLPAPRAGRVPRLPAREVQDPLPRADPDRPVGRGAVGGPRAGADRRRRDPRRGSRRSSSTCSPSAARSGSDERPASSPRSGRVLVTGISSFWGGRLAQALERDDSVETIIGVSPDDPTLELERTEFVRVGTQHALLRRIVQAAEIDTVIDSRLVVDSIQASARDAHEINVIGTMNILAACGGPDSPVRKVVFKSSAHYYGCERDDPAFFTEAMQRPHPPRTRMESRHRGGRERRARLRGAQRRTSRSRSCASPTASARTSRPPTATCSRCPRSRASSASTRATSSSTRTTSSACSSTRSPSDLPGAYNVAGDGVLVLSEVASLLGKPLAPILPPWGTGLATPGLRSRGVRIPDGDGPAAALRPRAGQPQAQGGRVPPALHHARGGRRGSPRTCASPSCASGGSAPYRYEREVEEFLRYSPSVRRRSGREGA